jgi:hypothetical protein
MRCDPFHSMIDRLSVHDDENYFPGIPRACPYDMLVMTCSGSVQAQAVHRSSLEGLLRIHK